MSVKRRMMLTSFSWNDSRRLRPRSLAALQADSASASERPRSLSRPLNGVTPRLIDRRKRASTPTVCRRVTPSRRPSPNIAASSISEGMTTAKRSPEMRAATEFGGRCLRSRSPICAMAWSPTCMPKFSLMTCSSSMSTYRRLQRCPRGLAFDEHELDALLERRARQQARQRVVTGLDARGDAARQQVGEMHVAADELRRFELAEQREHARGAAAALAQRAGEDAIRDRDLPGLGRDPVDHQRIAARLRDG